MHGLRPIGREHRVLCRGRLDADLDVVEVGDVVDLLFPVHVAETHRRQRHDMRALNLVVDHVLEGLGHAGIGERLHQVILRTEHEVDREHPGFRLQGRGIGGRGDAEIDIARTQLLQHLRLLAELRARELVDQQCVVAEFGELGGEGVAGDAVGGGVRLVIGEAEMPYVIGPCRIGHRRGGEKRHNTDDDAVAAQRHPQTDPARDARIYLAPATLDAVPGRVYGADRNMGCRCQPDGGLASFETAALRLPHDEGFSFMPSQNRLILRQRRRARLEGRGMALQP